MEGGVTPFSSGMAPSGSYILIVVSQPLSEDHKQIILQRLNTGLLSWDVNSTGCDLSGLENAFSSIIKERVIEGDVLIQHSTESLGVEVLLNPTVRTLKQCVKNLLSTSTSHKQLIHAGYTFAGSGSWILENGTFSFEEFLELFQQSSIPAQKRCTINVHCAEEGEWNKNNFSREAFTKISDISLNPSAKVNHVPGTEHLIKCLDSALVTQTLEEMMKPSPLVGNIRFNRPTIYMFPAGQGDCALFGVNGFNMLIDGGFHRKPCSWEFIRHLDRLDAVLVTRIGESNLCGMSTLMKRNALNNANPQIGYVFCNVSEAKPELSKEVCEIKDDLTVSVVKEGHSFVQTLTDLKLKPHQCWRDFSIDPFVLYHKVGQGTLEMHVLSPPRDSKEMKTFLSEWNAFKETFSGVKCELKNKPSVIPLSHATSICAILVWRPEDPTDTITRILFPGSAPQHKIMEGLDKLKELNILNYPVVTKASLNKLTTKTISNKIEKVTRTSLPNRNNTASPALSVSSIASKNGDIAGVKKEVKKVLKEVKRESKEIKKEVKKEIKKDTTKEVKKEIKSELAVKKESAVKKEPSKEVKKDNKEVKKVIKKDKEVKPVIEKKEIKSAPKKESSTPNNKITMEVKKTAAPKKSTTPVKKEVSKPLTTPKSSDVKKAVTKVSETKVPKDNKKLTESKTVAKAKPKATAATPKSTPKLKPVPVPKPGNKMTKAVAASSIVASAVAVTVAAVELNEKKDVIEDTEPEISEKEEDINIELKEAAENEKPVDGISSPIPPEALSPTPSESVSLTPSDTLSSAPLETVSPTPPLPNEPISTEEKDVNEIKDIEQDMPYEVDQQLAEDLEKGINNLEAALSKHNAAADVMSSSFMEDKQLVDNEECYEKDIQDNESVPVQVERDDRMLDGIEQIEETGDDKLLKETFTNEKEGEKEHEDKDDVEEKNVVEEENSEETSIEENVEGKESEEIIDEKDIDEEKYAEECKIIQEKEMDEKSMGGRDVSEENIVDEVDIQKEQISDEDIVTEKKIEVDIHEDNYAIENRAVDEKYVLDAKETAEEEDFVDKNVSDFDDLKEKSVSEEKEMHEKHVVDEKHEENIKSIDNQLNSLSMEGSFCAGMTSEVAAASDYSKENIDKVHEQYTDNSYNYEVDVEQVYEKKFATENYYQQTETFESHEKVESFTDEKQESFVELTSHHKEQVFKEHDIIQDSHSYLSDKPIEETENYAQNMLNAEKQSETEHYTDSEADERFDKLSQIHSMEASFHQDSYQDYDHPANFDDPEMQETSVDDPEDMERKESIVSITLNDDEENVDISRRKSYTESEDDVDIGKYMSKEQTIDDQKLHTQQESDSDEDVVKSPTPHAVVDYEGQAEELQDANKAANTNELKDNDTEMKSFLNEKQDFDEKDRDSAEEHDTDDGEMIIHPTSPGIKYSEEEMRDPIGQHFITNPALLAQGTDITEQPLYEEAEDSESERSASPIVEQPIFSSTAEANFPELVTVSGGTTPSEPQSPKTNFDAKKFASEAAVMDALSEHDISESSTHSPSCQDATAFELQTSDKSLIDAQSLQDVSQEEQIISATIETVETERSFDSSANAEQEKVINEETAICDEEDKEEKQETPSDEESSSEEENSESHSKDKSDAMGDKSDVERDDKSDVHTDKSDHHYDEKSDLLNDNETDKSDIHDDDHFQQQDKHMDQEFTTEHQYLNDDKELTEMQYETITYAHDAYAHKTSLDDYEQLNITEQILNVKPLSNNDNQPNQDVINSRENIENEERSYTFQSSEIYSENSESGIGINSVHSFTGEDKSQITTELRCDSVPGDCHQEVPYGFENTEHVTYQYSTSSNEAQAISSENIDLQHSEDENVGNKLPEILDQDYGNLPQHSQNDEIRSIPSGNNETDFEYPNTALKSYSTYVYSSEGTDEPLSTNHEDSKYDIVSSVDNFSSDNFKYSKEIHSNSEGFVEFAHTKDHVIESYSHSEMSTKVISDISQQTFEGISKNGIHSEVTDENFNDGENAYTTLLATVNGKDQEDVVIKSSEVTAEFIKTELTNSEGITSHQIQEPSFLLTERFHSDSPEDNTMRSDSSPDAPYSGDITEKFSEKNSLPVDETLESYIHNTDDYKNINYASSDVLPPPQNHSFNANRNTYTEDEGNLIHENVTTYAYTNKAYTREEEDIDGNHIYKEETTGVIKQMEFDGNNIQPFNTNQLGYPQDVQAGQFSTSSNYDFNLEEWGKPMGLPTPPDGSQKTVIKKVDKPAVKSKVDANGKIHSPSVSTKMSSPLKKPKPKAKESSSSPVYVDLAYVPQHADPNYCDVEFFKKIRARYYVFSSVNPSKEVLNALLEAKKTWNEDLSVTIIPTYETDTLGYWMAQNQNDLAEYSIDISPSASRCTVNLQDHQTSCSAYRLEF